MLNLVWFWSCTGSLRGGSKVVSQRMGLQFGSVSGSLKAFVVWTGTVSSVTHWLASIGAVLCGMHLLTKSRGSRLGP